MRRLGVDPVFTARHKVANQLAGYGAMPNGMAPPKMPALRSPNPAPPAMPTPASPAPNISVPKVKTSPLKPRIGKM